MHRLLAAARSGCLLAVLGACGSDAAGGSHTALSCPGTLPDCPTPAPAYADVAPIIAGHCTTCHRAGGLAASHDLTTYANVYAQRSAVLDQVHACTMPPYNGVALGEADYTLLVGWLSCHAPP